MWVQCLVPFFFLTVFREICSFWYYQLIREENGMGDSLIGSNSVFSLCSLKESIFTEMDKETELHGQHDDLF